MLAPENYFLATSRKPDMSISWLIAVLSVWVVSAVVLLSAPRVVKVLGHRGLMACEPDGDDSGDALRADAVRRYLQLNPANAK